LPTSHEVVLGRLAKALNDRDYDDFEEVLTPDYFEEYPQSGEVIRGRKNVRAVREYYPGGFSEESVQLDFARTVPAETRWLRTPVFTFVRAEGTGNSGTATFKARYPDGSIWWVVSLYELRGDQLARATLYFAPVFEAPEWRKPYVDKSAQA
jgi:SnoaL-like domain